MNNKQHQWPSLTEFKDILSENLTLQQLKQLSVFTNIPNSILNKWNSKQTSLLSFKNDLIKYYIVPNARMFIKVIDIN